MNGMTQPAAPRPADHAESLANLRLEQDALALYDALGSIEKDPRRAETFRTIAGNERRHAGIWADRLRALGAEVPPPARPRARVCLLYTSPSPRDGLLSRMPSSA